MSVSTEELRVIKKRRGIAENITVYDEDITSLIVSGRKEMTDAGVSDTLIASDMGINAQAFYVRAHLLVDGEVVNSEACMKRFWQLVQTLAVDTAIAAGSVTT